MGKEWGGERGDGHSVNIGDQLTRTGDTLCTTSATQKLQDRPDSASHRIAHNSCVCRHDRAATRTCVMSTGVTTMGSSPIKKRGTTPCATHHRRPVTGTRNTIRTPGALPSSPPPPLPPPLPPTPGEPGVTPPVRTPPVAPAPLLTLDADTTLMPRVWIRSSLWYGRRRGTGPFPTGVVVPDAPPPPLPPPTPPTPPAAVRSRMCATSLMSTSLSLLSLSLSPDTSDVADWTSDRLRLLSRTPTLRRLLRFRLSDV